MENKFGNGVRGHLVNPLPHSKVYKCIAPSCHLRKFWCYQCTTIIILHAVINRSLKNTGIFTIKAQVVVCSVVTHWHYAEVSGVTVSTKTILSLPSKGVGGRG